VDQEPGACPAGVVAHLGSGYHGQSEKSRTFALTTGITCAMGKILSAVVGTLASVLMLTARTQPR